MSTPSITRDEFIAWAHRFVVGVPADALIYRSRIPGNLSVLAADGTYLGYGDPIFGEAAIITVPEEE